MPMRRLLVLETAVLFWRVALQKEAAMLCRAFLLPATLRSMRKLLVLKLL
jgi:hypothetical protein